MLAKPLALSLLALASTIPQVAALGQEQCILFPKPIHRHPLLTLASNTISYAQSIFPFSSNPDSTGSLKRPFIIADRTSHTVVPIVTSSEDDIAIHMAVLNFADDIHKVTGLRPLIYNDTLPRHTKKAIVVGSLDTGLIGSQHFPWTGEMEGRWEVWDARVVREEVTGVGEALVLTGSDRVRLTSLIPLYPPGILSWLAEKILPPILLSSPSPVPQSSSMSRFVLSPPR